MLVCWLGTRIRQNVSMAYEFERTQRIAILGGGPGGYEAALAGAQLGAEVTLVERAGVGGSAVLTDVVPSKTLIATAEAAERRRARPPTSACSSSRAATPVEPSSPRSPSTSPPSTSACCGSPRQQSEDMNVAARSRPACASSAATAASTGRTRSSSRRAQGKRHRLRRVEADTHRRLGRRAARASCRRAMPDGERILTWTQLYHARRRARAPHRRRLRRHGRRVRVGLPRARREGHARLEPRPGAARRGRRRGSASSRRSSSATA